MKTLIVIFLSILIIILTSNAVIANSGRFHRPREKYNYYIQPGITVLVYFDADPYTRCPESLERITIAKEYGYQKVTLLHKHSGPGIYAFYVDGLIIENSENGVETVTRPGYFLAKKKYLKIVKKGK